MLRNISFSLKPTHLLHRSGSKTRGNKSNTKVNVEFNSVYHKKIELKLSEMDVALHYGTSVLQDFGLQSANRALALKCVRAISP